MIVNCECMGKKCALLVNVTQEDYQRLTEENLVVISKYCKHGPEKTDELVEGNFAFPYSLHKEKK